MRKWGAGSPCAPRWPNRYDWTENVFLPKGVGRFTPPSISLGSTYGPTPDKLHGFIVRTATMVSIRLELPWYGQGNDIRRYEPWDANGDYKVVGGE